MRQYIFAAVVVLLSAQAATSSGFCNGYYSLTSDYDRKQIQYCLDVAKVDPRSVFKFERMGDAKLEYFAMAKQYGVRFPNKTLVSAMSLSFLKCISDGDAEEFVCKTINQVRQRTGSTQQDCYEERRNAEQQCFADRADAWIGLGVDIEAPGFLGRTPLEDAIEFRKYPYAKVLLNNGAEIKDHYLRMAQIRAPDIYDEMQNVISIRSMTTTHQ